MKQRILRVLTLVCAAASTEQCAGADVSLSVKKIDQNSLRLLREIEDAEATAALVQPPPPPPERATRTLTVGFARELDQNGDQASSTPFLFGLEQGNWQYQVSGGGYVWARSGEERTRGVADVSALVAYAFPLNSKVALIPAFELTLPTHGEVGSSRLSEDVRLSIVFNASKTWSWSLGGLLARVEQASPSASRYTQAIAAKAIYSWNSATSAFVSFTCACTFCASRLNPLKTG